MTDYETKDSGQRAQFDSGMQRDTNAGKPRFDLLVPLNVPYEHQMLTRFAALMERGARKYDPRNWEKANSTEELERMRESAFRHFMAWFAGEIDEDHAAASFFNILAAETTAYKIEEAKRVGSIAGLGAPTHRRHLDGSITDLATGRVVARAHRPKPSAHPDDKVSSPEPLDDFGRPFPKGA